ncbi:MAG: hypothetical protein K0Q72_1112, partial [Armatimonadetes bacterium]|nr:hypothetical protein [Armatimonadota bacterium]
MHLRLNSPLCVLRVSAVNSPFPAGYAAGDVHALALKRDGSVIAWGDDTNGQATVPHGFSEVVAISSSRDHNLALKRDGTIVTWGENANSTTTVPAGLTGVTAISAGFHNLALCG